MVERIIFDLDDTLLNTGVKYREQLKKFARKVNNYFDSDLNSSTVIDKQQEIDQQSVKEEGMKKGRFPQSLSKTWEYYCRKFDRTIRDRDLKKCEQIGWDVYDEIPGPVEGMTNVLDELSAQRDLILYTMGDPGIQQEKIRHHELERWFKEIHIVPIKSTDSLEPLVAPYPPEYVAIVGDSLRGEIRPGVELDLLTVHCEKGEQWDYHLVDVGDHYHTIKHLPELMEVLNER